MAVAYYRGGEEVLLDYAGQDATEAFEEIGHSDDARSIMNKNVIADAKIVVCSYLFLFLFLCPGFDFARSRYSIPKSPHDT